MHYAGINENNPNSWKLNRTYENYNILKEMAARDYKSDSKNDMPNSLPGVMFRKPNGLNPIADKDSLDQY